GGEGGHRVRVPGRGRGDLLRAYAGQHRAGPGACRPGEPDRHGEGRRHRVADRHERDQDQNGEGAVKFSPERVATLAGQLVAKLVSDGLIEPVADRRALTVSLERVIVDELSGEERINADAK